MTNLESRLILFSITKYSRKAADISNRIKVPLISIPKITKSSRIIPSLCRKGGIC